MKTNKKPYRRSILLRHYARMIFVPHKKNGYRPHLIRWTGIVGMVTLIAALQAIYNTSQSGSVLGAGTDITSQQLLAQTNAQREAKGLSVLTLSQRLAVGATMKANDMFIHQYWAHTSPSGVTPWSWFEKADYNYSYAGENLAKNFQTSNGVMEAWMNSPEHRANILDPQYTNVGFAVVPGLLNGKETTLVVAFYGTPQTTTVTATSTSPTVFAANDQSPNLVTRFGVAIQSLTPAVIGSLAVLVVGITVALIAHAYRKKLPHEWQKSWRIHHGLYKVVGMITLAFVLIALYGGGQV